MAKKWIPVGLTEKLAPGDRVSMKIVPRFPWLGSKINTALVAAKIAAAEDRPEFNVIRYNYTDAGVELDIEIKSMPAEYVYRANAFNVSALIAIVIGLTIIAVAVTTYKVVDVAEEFADDPVMKYTAATMGTAGTIGLALIAFLVISKRFGK